MSPRSRRSPERGCCARGPRTLASGGYRAKDVAAVRQNAGVVREAPRTLASGGYKTWVHFTDVAATIRGWLRPIRLTKSCLRHRCRVCRSVARRHCEKGPPRSHPGKTRLRGPLRWIRSAWMILGARNRSFQARRPLPSIFPAAGSLPLTASPASSSRCRAVSSSRRASLPRRRR